MKKGLTFSNLEYSVVPRPNAVLVVKKNETTLQSQILLVGPHLKNLKRTIKKDEKWFIAVLKPGAPTSLFNLSAAVPKDEVFDLKQLQPGIANEIEMSFLKEFDPEILNRILLSCNPKEQIDAIVPKAISMLTSTESQRVTDVAKELGITIRKLQREFIKWVGVSPKQFQSINRLRASLIFAAKDNDNNWTQIAAKSGYFDQPHLNKNMGNILSLRPTEIRK